MHDQSIWLSEVRIALDYGIDADWSLSVLVPFRVVGTDIVFRDLAGNVIVLDYENIHHRKATLTGISDSWVLVRGKASWLGFTFVGQGGLSIPLGRSEPDPFEAAEHGARHEHVQFGSGTYRPIVGGSIDRRLGGLTVGVWGLGILSFYPNGFGFQTGQRVAGGILASSSLGGDLVTFKGGVEAQAELAERWRGEVPISDGNRGRVDFLASVGALLALPAGWSLDATLKAPFATHVVGGQLSYPVLLELGMAKRIAP